MRKIRKMIREKAEISTASLPDIVFLLLFFFMVTATIKKNDDELNVQLPDAQAVTQVDKKILIKELMIGAPKKSTLGSQTKIFSEGKYLDLRDIPQWVLEQKASLPEVYRDQMIVMLKADEYVKMGMISDIQAKLRTCNTRKVLYRTKDQ